MRARVHVPRINRIESSISRQPGQARGQSAAPGGAAAPLTRSCPAGSGWRACWRASPPWRAHLRSTSTRQRSGWQRGEHRRHCSPSSPCVARGCIGAGRAPRLGCMKRFSPARTMQSGVVSRVLVSGRRCRARTAVAGAVGVGVAAVAHGGAHDEVGAHHVAVGVARLVLAANLCAARTNARSAPAHARRASNTRRTGTDVEVESQAAPPVLLDEALC